MHGEVKRAQRAAASHGFAPSQSRQVRGVPLRKSIPFGECPSPGLGQPPPNKVLLHLLETSPLRDAPGRARCPGQSRPSAARCWAD